MAIFHFDGLRIETAPAAAPDEVAAVTAALELYVTAADYSVPEQSGSRWTFYGRAEAVRLDPHWRRRVTGWRS